MKVTVAAVVLLGLLAVAYAACPNECSGHGRCVSNECQCEEYWLGVDCSMYTRPVSPSTTLDMTVPTYKWQFFTYNLQSDPARLTWHIKQTTTGDADLYLKLNDYPRRDDFDAVNVSREGNFTVTVENPRRGTWYAGVFGYQGCSYQITLHVEQVASCPNDCSHHGNCVDGTCTCTEDYTGDDCGTHIHHLTSGEERSSRVESSQWEYYYVDTTGANALRVIVNETSVGDSDLYISFNKLPGIWDFDVRDATLEHNYVLTLENVQQGRYYIGVYGYRAVSYNIKTLYGEVQACAFRCSDHGDCQGTTCHCEPEFSGEQCETMVPEMELSTWVHGFVRDNSWNYYHISPDSAANLVISVTQEPGGDCDLYVKQGENPQRFDFDRRDVSYDLSFQLTIENPQDQTWYIGMYGYHECSYRIQVATSLSACPNGCSQHGRCVHGRCDCAAGWAGEDCAAPLHHLVNGQDRSDFVNMNNWQYYKFPVPQDTSYLAVTVREFNTTGNLWLYVNQGAPPTLTDYGFSETSLDKANHLVSFRTDARNQNPTYYVGVYGNPLTMEDHPVQYTIVAYSPPL